jgi:predicted enzyme related to lactoylglutathione lyase
MTIRTSIPSGAPAWIDLASTDTDASRRFYSGLFDWTFDVAPAEFGGYISAFKDGHQIAGIMQAQDDGPADVWAVYLAVENARETLDAAEAAGGSVAMEPMTVGELGTMGFVVDPSGASVGVWQPGTHTGFTLTDSHGTPAWYELHTRDYAAVLPFYRRVFGWTTETMGDTDEFRYSVLAIDGEQRAGVMDSAAFLPASVASQWITYFETDNANETVARAVALGGAVIRPAENTPYGRLAALTDSTGAAFNVIERTAALA